MPNLKCIILLVLGWKLCKGDFLYNVVGTLTCTATESLSATECEPSQHGPSWTDVPCSWNHTYDLPSTHITSASLEFDVGDGDGGFLYFYIDGALTEMTVTKNNNGVPGAHACHSAWDTFVFDLPAQVFPQVAAGVVRFTIAGTLGAYAVNRSILKINYEREVPDITKEPQTEGAVDSMMQSIAAIETSVDILSSRLNSVTSQLDLINEVLNFHGLEAPPPLDCTESPGGWEGASILQFVTSDTSHSCCKLCHKHIECCKWQFSDDSDTCILMDDKGVKTTVESWVTGQTVGQDNQLSGLNIKKPVADKSEL